MADPAPAPAVAPGWTTTEFWSTAMVHVVALASVVLTFTTGSDDGIDGVEALIPVVAIVLSGVAHVAYTRSRTRLKLEHLAVRARALEQVARRAAPVAEQLEQALTQPTQQGGTA
jgi:hypothetical protein